MEEIRWRKYSVLLLGLRGSSHCFVDETMPAGRNFVIVYLA